MTDEKLANAIEEAERFLKRALRLQEERETKADWDCGVMNANVKRASLDLTRSLARLRNPDAR